MTNSQRGCCRYRPFLFDAVLSDWGNTIDQDSVVYCEGIRTYERMSRQLHLYVCKTSDHNAAENRTLLHRATDWIQFEKTQDDLSADADVCIVPFASGGNGCFVGDYTGWPQGVGECNAHCMIVTNNAVVAAFDTFVVIGAMQVKLGATTDLQTLPDMIQPSKISCNLHVAAPATCMLLQAFTTNLACRLYPRSYPSNGSWTTPPVLHQLQINYSSMSTCKTLAPLSSSRSKTTCMCSITNLQPSAHSALRWLCASRSAPTRASNLLQPSGGNIPFKS